jgi:DNA repair protein RadC
MGSLDQTTAHPCEVFKPAILANAAAIIRIIGR